MISSEKVRKVLRLSLGDEIADSPGFAEDITHVLESYTPGPDSLSALLHRTEDCLFNGLYNQLGPEMTVHSPNGEKRRVFISELPSLADELLFPLFSSLCRNASNYALLHSFWLSSGSLSAMCALYRFFPGYLPVPDRLLMERVARENFSAYLRENMLPSPGGRG